MSKTSREIVLDILLDIEKSDRFAGEALGEALRANQFMNKKERAVGGAELTETTKSATEENTDAGNDRKKKSEQKIRAIR